MARIGGWDANCKGMMIRVTVGREERDGEDWRMGCNGIMRRGYDGKNSWPGYPVSIDQNIFFFVMFTFLKDPNHENFGSEFLTYSIKSL
jgi:hypothetical protein